MTSAPTVERTRLMLSQQVESHHRRSFSQLVLLLCPIGGPPESLACLHRYKTGLRGKTYNFSRVFDGGTTQEAYFDATAGPMVTTSRA